MPDYSFSAGRELDGDSRGYRSAEEQARELTRSIRREVNKLSEQWNALIERSDAWMRKLDDTANVSTLLPFTNPESHLHPRTVSLDMNTNILITSNTVNPLRPLKKPLTLTFHDHGSPFAKHFNVLQHFHFAKSGMLR